MKNKHSRIHIYEAGVYYGIDKALAYNSLGPQPTFLKFPAQLFDKEMSGGLMVADVVDVLIDVLKVRSKVKKTTSKTDAIILLQQARSCLERGEF